MIDGFEKYNMRYKYYLKIANSSFSAVFFKLFIFLFAAVPTKGQTISKMDQHNGLSHFKFGSTVSQYEGKIKKSNSNLTQFGESYIVTDKKERTILGLTTDFILLTFKRNKLYSIYIVFTCDDSNKNFDLLQYYIERLFGKPNPGNIVSNNDDNTIMTNGFRWTGKHTELDLLDYYRSGYHCYYSSIYYYSKDIEKSSLLKEF